MLGTDGFGNLLPFMPIKQDWFFKYVYKSSSNTSVIIESSDFGDEDRVVFVVSAYNGSDEGELFFSNDTGVKLNIDFAYMLGSRYTDNNGVVNIPLRKTSLEIDASNVAVGYIGSGNFVTYFTNGIFLISKS